MSKKPGRFVNGKWRVYRPTRRELKLSAEVSKPVPVYDIKKAYPSAFPDEQDPFGLPPVKKD